MLPFDRRPWAKTLATAVTAVCLVAASIAAYVLYLFQELHVPEVLIIMLLLLTIVPPNLAIVLRQEHAEDADDEDEMLDALPTHQFHTR